MENKGVLAVMALNALRAAEAEQTEFKSNNEYKSKNYSRAYKKKSSRPKRLFHRQKK